MGLYVKRDVGKTIPLGDAEEGDLIAFGPNDAFLVLKENFKHNQPNAYGPALHFEGHEAGISQKPVILLDLLTNKLTYAYSDAMCYVLNGTLTVTPRR
jgi:hypothetical protein